MILNKIRYSPNKKCPYFHRFLHVSMYCIRPSFLLRSLPKCSSLLFSIFQIFFSLFSLVSLFSSRRSVLFCLSLILMNLFPEVHCYFIYQFFSVNSMCVSYVIYGFMCVIVSVPRSTFFLSPFLFRKKPKRGVFKLLPL